MAAVRQRTEWSQCRGGLPLGFYGPEDRIRIPWMGTLRPVLGGPGSAGMAQVGVPPRDWVSGLALHGLKETVSGLDSSVHNVPSSEGADGGRTPSGPGTIMAGSWFPVHTLSTPARCLCAARWACAGEARGGATPSTFCVYASPGPVEQARRLF